jgi:succinate dehydrogenase / fumarate reductase cytochrome b subunit
MKHNQPSPLQFWRWFDPRARQAGTWAFILNRITALGLTFYLFMHLIVLGQLALGPEYYDGFVALAKTPLVKIGELAVIAAGIIHGLNGMRIAINSVGIGVRYQKSLLFGLMSLAAVGIFVFFVRMFLME